MGLIPSEHFELLLDPRNLRDNPFALRDSRRDTKRRQPARSFAWTLTFLALFSALGGLGLTLLARFGMGIPWYAGGSAGTLLCISICGIHALFVQAAAQKHTAGMVTLEQRRNTLQGLLMLPVPAFQVVIQAAVYPWIAAMRLALLGLPFYAACLAMGGVRPLDLLMLYVVFGGLAISIPPCRLPARSDSATPTMPASGPETTTATGAAAQESPGGSSALTMMLFGAGFLSVVIATSRGVPALYSEVHRYLPAPVIDVAPSAFLSWPLLIARLLIAPLDWYGIPVPPILLVIPSFLLGRYLQAARAAEYLEVAQYRDLAALPTYARRRWLQGLLSTSRAFVVIGYGWRWGVADGGLAPIVRIAGPAAGLAGFILLLLFVAVWRAMSRAGAVGDLLGPRVPPRIPVKRLAVRRTSARQAARHVLTPVIGAAAFLVGALVLSRTVPTDARLIPLAGRLLAIGAGGAALAFAMRRAHTPLILVGLLLPLLVLAGPPDLRPLAVFSPTLGMLGQANPSVFINLPYIGAPLGALFRQPPVWWAWPLASGAPAVLFLIWTSAAPAHGQQTDLEASPGPVALDPTMVGAEPFMDATLPVVLGASARPDHTPIGKHLIHLVQRSADNAVAVKELRVRLRGRLSPREFRAALMVLLIVTAALFASPAVARQFGAGALIFYGPRGSPPPLPAYVLGCWYLAMLWLSFAAGLGVLPFAFAPEREKATLGFLLTTPMRAHSIVLGKLVGLMIPLGITSAYVAIWSLVLTVVFLPTLGPPALFAWAAVALTGLLLMLGAATFSLAFGALFPRHVRQAGCGVLLYLMIYQVPLQGMLPALRAARGARRRRRRPTLLSGLFATAGSVIWIAFCAASVLLIVLFLGLAVWGVRRMRKGDIAFELSKRDN